MRYLLPLLLCAFALPGRAETGAVGPPDPVVSAMVSSALEEANRVRLEYHLSPFVLDPPIAAAAQGHASDMDARDYFDHAGRDGRSPFDRMRDAGAAFASAAENIALGQKTAALAFRAWLNSPGHRKNLLNPRYHRQGIGWANGYWVHDLAD